MCQQSVTVHLFSIPSDPSLCPAPFDSFSLLSPSTSPSSAPGGLLTARRGQQKR